MNFCNSEPMQTYSDLATKGTYQYAFPSTSVECQKPHRIAENLIHRQKKTKKIERKKEKRRKKSNNDQQNELTTQNPSNKRSTNYIVWKQLVQKLLFFPSSIVFHTRYISLFWFPMFPSVRLSFVVECVLCVYFVFFLFLCLHSIEIHIYDIYISIYILFHCFFYFFSIHFLSYRCKANACLIFVVKNDVLNNSEKQQQPKGEKNKFKIIY